MAQIRNRIRNVNNPEKTTTTRPIRNKKTKKVLHLKRTPIFTYAFPSPKISHAIHTQKRTDQFHIARGAENFDARCEKSMAVHQATKSGAREKLRKFTNKQSENWNVWDSLKACLVWISFQSEVLFTKNYTSRTSDFKARVWLPCIFHRELGVDGAVENLKIRRG